MSNNFRITGTQYYSKSGNDANAGTSPDLPKATLGHIAGQTAIVGAGVYKGAFTIATGGSAPSYIADGTVVIDATGNIVAQPNDNVYTTFLNTSTQNKHTIWVRLNGFSYSASRGQYHNNVNFINGLYTHSTSSTTQPIVLNSNFSSIVFSTVFVYNFDYTKFFNSTVTLPGATLKNSYVDEATIFIMPTFFSSPSTQFLNCDFMGKFNVAGTLYELKKDKLGVDIPARIGNGIADIIAIYPTVYTTGKNFAQDPEFINISKTDYISVAPSSPNLNADSTGTGSIGNVVAAKVFKATDTEFASPVTSEDIIASVGDLIFDPAALDTDGTLLSQPLQIANAPAQVRRIRAIGALQFNSLETIGGAENTSVLSVFNYAGGTAGANPRRLTGSFRWSNVFSLTAPTVWNNQGYIAEDAFAIFEYGTEPLIDTSGRGNGDPLFNPAGASPIQAMWMQELLTIQKGIG